MNLPLPKRLSGRRTQPECPGQPEQAGGADLDAEHAAYMSWVAATVGDHGWAVTGRHGDEAAPPWAYSVGMWVSHQVPELILCGLPVGSGAAIINAIGARIADGARIGPGNVIDDGYLPDIVAPFHWAGPWGVRGVAPQGDHCSASLALRPVESSWRATDGLLGISNSFYGMVRPPYLQVVWSDRSGRFPGEQGFQSRFSGMQPLLWLPRDDNPPSTWTRLERLR
ncbi:MAG: DUF4262 domain-containing protein [Trebonia sp.]